MESSYCDEVEKKTTAVVSKVKKEKNVYDSEFEMEIVLNDINFGQETNVGNNKIKKEMSVPDRHIKKEKFEGYSDIEEESSVGSKNVEQESCSNESNVNAAIICKREFESDNEAGDVKKVCLAGGDNITKEVDWMVGTRAKVLEIKGSASCSQKQVSAREIMGVKEKVPKGIFPIPSTSGTAKAKRSVSSSSSCLRKVRGTRVPKVSRRVTRHKITSPQMTPKRSQAKPFAPWDPSISSIIASKGFLRERSPQPMQVNTNLNPADLTFLDLIERGNRMSIFQAPIAASTASSINTTAASNVTGNVTEVGVSKANSKCLVTVIANTAVTGIPARLVHDKNASILPPTGACVTYLLPLSRDPMQLVQHIQQLQRGQKMVQYQQIVKLQHPIQLQQVSQVQQGRQGQVIITHAPKVRPASVASASKSPALPSFCLKDGKLVPVTQVADNAHSLLRRPGNTSGHIGAPQTSQQIRWVTSGVRMPASAAAIATTAAVPAVVPVHTQVVATHPAPLPPTPPGPLNASNKLPPPEPNLSISRNSTDNKRGITLSWNMNVTEDNAEIDSYQLYAYQETASPPRTTLWKKIGVVKPLPLPMACTITQFVEGHRYHFAVRAVDIHARCGPFSLPGYIVLP